MVANTDAQGVRKVKNFTLTLTANYNDYADNKYIEGDEEINNLTATNDILPLTYALIYVPSQQTDLPLNASSPAFKNLYGINNYVILSGTIDKNNTICVKSKLARNLNAGDSIKLKIHNGTGKQIKDVFIYATLNYAISYN